MDTAVTTHAMNGALCTYLGQSDGGASCTGWGEAGRVQAAVGEEGGNCCSEDNGRHWQGLARVREHRGLDCAPMLPSNLDNSTVIRPCHGHLQYNTHSPILFPVLCSGEPAPSLPRLRCNSSTSFLLIVSCSSKDGKSALNRFPGPGAGFWDGSCCNSGGGGGWTTRAASFFRGSSRGGSCFRAGLLGGGEGVSPPSFTSLPSLSFFHPPPPDGTRATEGSFPAFSLRKLGREAGLGILRLVATTFPRLWSP